MWIEKVAIFFLVAIFIFGICAVTVHAENYQNVAIVVKVEEGNLITVRDIIGELWQFYSVGEWEVNDLIVMEMDDMDTITIYDDEIQFVYFVGIYPAVIRPPNIFRC